MLRLLVIGFKPASRQFPRYSSSTGVQALVGKTLQTCKQAIPSVQVPFLFLLVIAVSAASNLQAGNSLGTGQCGVALGDSPALLQTCKRNSLGTELTIHQHASGVVASNLQAGNSLGTVVADMAGRFALWSLQTCKQAIPSVQGGDATDLKDLNPASNLQAGNSLGTERIY